MSIQKWLSKAAEYFQDKDYAGEEDVGKKLEALRQARFDPKESDQAIACLLDRNKQIRDEAAAILAEQDRRPVNPVEKSIFLISNRDWERLRTLSTAELIKAWEKKDSLSPGGFWTLYLLATLQALGRVAVEPLARLITEHERPMNSRILALWSLGLLGAEEGLPGLRTVWKGDRNQRMRLAAVQACRFLGSAALGLLVEILTAAYEDGEVRTAAARGVGALGESAVDELEGLLRDQDRSVREHAALALFFTADPRGLVSLYPLRFSDQDGQARSAISRFLIGLGGDGRGWNDLADKERAAALLSPEKCLDRLKLIEDEDLLAACVLALGNRGDARAAGPLMQTAMYARSDALLIEAWMALTRLSEYQEARSCLLSGLHYGEEASRFWAGLALLMAGEDLLHRL